MPRYTIVDSPTYIDATMRQIGEVVDYAGWPGSTLQPEPGDEVARRVKDAYEKATKGGGRNRLPRVPDLAAFADAPEKPVKGKPVKDE